MGAKPSWEKLGAHILRVIRTGGRSRAGACRRFDNP